MIFINSRSFIHLLNGVYYKPTWWPALSWIVSSVGRALHQYLSAYGFKSCTYKISFIFNSSNSQFTYMILIYSQLVWSTVCWVFLGYFPINLKCKLFQYTKWCHWVIVIMLCLGASVMWTMFKIFWQIWFCLFLLFLFCLFFCKILIYVTFWYKNVYKWRFLVSTYFLLGLVFSACCFETYKILASFFFPFFFPFFFNLSFFFK